MVKKPQIKPKISVHRFICKECQSFIGENAFISCFESEIVLCKECAEKHAFPCIMKKLNEFDAKEELSFIENTLKTEENKALINVITPNLVGKPGEIVKVVFEITNKSRIPVESNKMHFIFESSNGIAVKKIRIDAFINSNTAQILEIPIKIEENRTQSYKIEVTPILSSFSIESFICKLTLEHPAIQKVKDELGITSSYKAQLIVKEAQKQGISVRQAHIQLESSEWS